MFWIVDPSPPRSEVKPAEQPPSEGQLPKKVVRKKTAKK